MHLTRKKTSPGHNAQSGDVLIQIDIVSRIRGDHFLSFS